MKYVAFLQDCQTQFKLSFPDSDRNFREKRVMKFPEKYQKISNENDDENKKDTYA